MSAIQCFRGAARTKPDLIASTNIFGTEYFSSVGNEPAKPISGGLFRVEKGESMEFKYDFHETKYVIEGEFNIQTATGQNFTANAGDILYFPNGCAATFSSNTYGLAFYKCAQRPGHPSVEPTAKL